MCLDRTAARLTLLRTCQLRAATSIVSGEGVESPAVAVPLLGPRRKWELIR